MSPLKRSTGLELGRLTKDDGVDYRAAIASELRIIKDTANSRCFAFNEGDDDGVSGDSNMSTMSVGPWLQDI